MITTELLFIDIAWDVLNGRLMTARNKAMGITKKEDRDHALGIIAGNTGN